MHHGQALPNDLYLHISELGQRHFSGLLGRMSIGSPEGLWRAIQFSQGSYKIYFGLHTCSHTLQIISMKRKDCLYKVTWSRSETGWWLEVPTHLDRTEHWRWLKCDTKCYFLIANRPSTILVTEFLKVDQQLYEEGTITVLFLWLGKLAYGEVKLVKS